MKPNTRPKDNNFKKNQKAIPCHKSVRVDNMVQ